MNTLLRFAGPALAVGALAAGAATPVAATSSSDNDAILGDLHPSTGIFVPKALILPHASVARTGTVKVTITLAIESSIGSDQPITCEVSISAGDTSFVNSATASATVVRSGATGTCTISIPYDWTMATTGETATVSVTASTGSFSGGIFRNLTLIHAGFAVPATAGTVTTLAFSASM
jgi:hypothetical protein